MVGAKPGNFENYPLQNAGKWYLGTHWHTFTPYNS